MKVRFIGRCDPANTSHRIARALRKLGIDARAFVREPHPFWYQETLISSVDLARELAGCDWIIESGAYDLDFFWELRPRPQFLGLRHSGTWLRGDVELAMAHDASWCALTLVPLDLYDAAHTIDPERVYPFIQPQDSIVDHVPKWQSISYAHSPSERRTKGTKYVMRALERMRVPHELIERQPYPDCRKRRDRHAVYIDQVSPLGNIGAAVCEAASAGQCVIANTSRISQCSPVTVPPVIPCDDQAMLEYLISGYLTLDQVQYHAELMHAWAREWLDTGYAAKLAERLTNV